MRKWFVYVDIDYYPVASVVEATSPEAAIEIVVGEWTSRGDTAYYVVPFDAANASGTDWRIENWQASP